MYKIEFTGEAESFLYKIDAYLRQIFLKKIKKLKKNPYIGKPLTGKLSMLWRLRIDKYRVIYQIIQNKLIVIVISIGHRKNVYS